MILDAAAIVALEHIAARAWPAARQAEIGGWRLYGSAGFSGRINACWPLEPPERPWRDAVAETEAWYAAQSLPTLFKVVDSACEPRDLPVRLDSLGFRPRTETIMMLGPARGRADPSVRVSQDIDETFAAVFNATADDPADARERLETLARIPLPRAVAQATIEGEPAAIGACAVEGEWAGVFAMRTDPRHRRRGLARRILEGLMAAAAEAGAERAWLQVEADNPAAIALYQAAGFEEAYRYSYWFRPGA